MTSNNDPADPSNKNGRDGNGSPAATGSPSGAGPRRPHATLDLQAVEIKPRRETRATAPPEVKPGNDAKSPPTETASRSPIYQSSETTMTTDQTKTDTQETTAQGRGDGNGTPPSEPPRKRGGFFSHLFAAVVGGTIALVAGDWAVNKLGVPIPYRASMQGMDSLESRLAQLEEQVANVGTAGGEGGDVSNLALQQASQKLQAMSDSVATLAVKQAKMEEALEAVREQSGTVAADADLSTRIAGLEEQLTTLSAAAEGDDSAGSIPQLAALTAKMGELEQRLAAEAAKPDAGVDDAFKSRVVEAETAAVTAKSDAERLDKDLSALKTNATRLDERMEALKTQSDRIEENLKVLREADAKSAAELQDLKRELTTELGAVARPSDINQAVTPFTARIGELEEQLAELQKLEAESRENARKVVASLELASLKRTLDTGEPFAEELSKVQNIAGEADELSGLQKYASSGVPTVESLQASFQKVIPDMLSAGGKDDDSSILERFVNQAKSVVRVRKVAVDPNDKSTEAVIARMENALKSADLEMVLKEAESLEPAAKAVASNWLDQVRARQSVNIAIASLEQDLKNTLSQTTTGRP